MTYEKLITLLKEHRDKAEQAEVEFFLFLVVAETQYDKVWKNEGYSTFDQVIRSNNFCHLDRYNGFRHGLDRVGASKARAHGVGWVIEAGKLRDPSPERIEEMEKLAEKFEATHRTHPSDQSAERMRHFSDAKAPPGNKESDASKVKRLEAEKRELQAQVKKLEKENRRLVAALNKHERPRASP